MSKPILFTLLLTTALSGCADPPGLPKPKPFDLQEEQRSSAAYNKYKLLVQQMDGVVTTYLTRNNNPRQMIVIVKDHKSEEAVWQAYGHAVERDGVPMSIKVQDRDVPDDAPIEAVPTQTVPDTWWGKLVSFFQGLSVPWMPAKKQ